MAVNSGLNLLGSQFVEVGTDAALDINEAIQNNGLPGLTEDGSDFSTKVLVWTGNGYRTYGFLTEEEAIANEWPEAADKWLLEDFSDIAVVPVPAGDGFWVQTTGTGAITLIGQVPAAATTDVTINPGLNLISCPYAKEINIQDVTVNGLPGLTEDGSDFSTKVLVWTGNGYRTYGFLTEEEAIANEWPEAADKWLLEDFSDIANVTIPAGAGFWVQTTGTGSVTFTK